MLRVANYTPGVSQAGDYLPVLATKVSIAFAHSDSLRWGGHLVCDWPTSLTCARNHQPGKGGVLEPCARILLRMQTRDRSYSTSSQAVTVENAYAAGALHGPSGFGVE